MSLHMRAVTPLICNSHGQTVEAKFLQLFVMSYFMACLRMNLLSVTAKAPSLLHFSDFSSLLLNVCYRSLFFFFFPSPSTFPLHFSSEMECVFFPLQTTISPGLIFFLLTPSTTSGSCDFMTRKKSRNINKQGKIPRMAARHSQNNETKRFALL